MAHANLCSVCNHPKVREIDALLLAGIQLTVIARRFGFKRQSGELKIDNLSRHRSKGHIIPVHHPPESAAPPVDEEGEVEVPTTAVGGLKALIQKLEKIQRGELSPSPAAQISRELRLTYESLAKIQGPEEPPEVNLADVPEWIELRERIMAALAPWPDAKKAVLEAVTDP